MSIKPSLPRSFLLVAAALVLLVMLVVMVDRVPRPAAVAPAADRGSDLSRAMTFSRPADPKR